MEVAKETKFDTKAAYRGRGWCPNFDYVTTCIAQKKRAISHSTMKTHRKYCHVRF